jgi:hypothetical protein
MCRPSLVHPPEIRRLRELTRYGRALVQARTREQQRIEKLLEDANFGANSAWGLCAAIAHNLLRAAATLAGSQHAAARGSTLRRKIVNIPARLTRPQRKPILHLPSHWPWADAWLALWRNTIGYPHRQPA